MRTSRAGLRDAVGLGESRKDYFDGVSNGREISADRLQLFLKLGFELCFQLGFERSLKSRFEPALQRVEPGVELRLEPAFEVCELRVESRLESTFEFREPGFKLRVPLVIEFLEAIGKKPVDKLGLLAELFFDGFGATLASSAATRTANDFPAMRVTSARTVPRRR